MSADLITPGAGAAVLADSYTQEFQALAKKHLPITLSNEEYTTRLAALIVAFNRLLAEYVVTSSVVNQCPLHDIVELTGHQFLGNVNQAQQALAGEGSTVQ